MPFHKRMSLRQCLVILSLTVVSIYYLGTLLAGKSDYLYDYTGRNKQSLTPHCTFNKTNRLTNSIVTEYNADLRARLKDLISLNVSSRDPSLISLIREMMDAPSGHIVKTVRQIEQTPQNKEIIKILNKKKGGIFVEAGGLDGERSSNTLYLEQKMGWTGLLVEMDPYFYTQLLGKNRRSWSINACISPNDHPSEMPFKESSGGHGQLVQEGEKLGRAVIHSVPCFPLESLLLAINKTHVDYFSLDVEGFELDVLKTIPFDRVDITTLSVEYRHGRSGKEQYRKFMTSKGYKVHKDINFMDIKIAMYVDDFIFVKM